ncbi:Hsp20/alpha crystallin family protein [Pseudomonas putida]|uniref:Hsp20/alpha crystallin family protein n=2 Tax=Pseudomonas putida group TaxID=136845 RepID=A0A2N1ILW7_9PSED|nr:MULTISPECIES: Hsp20/alpha crystallin family protein [Pseudomonas]EKT4454267.1 Hsp20/alpha crystallin family protein [Pseudomonas putida]EKT4469662.1 Hsp20/alpha crystallin family protein [Pseudomonas putida]EKT4493249.1 Hsp20/alpha crystallin family protein [Pseudomonas putida]EKT4511082.1 Hsp20/alpha crystallin family protein [Pseudomonas putida]EKT8863860.1 Hsp20/alpha crystallin family protein [Pseudomonas putida]
MNDKQAVVRGETETQTLLPRVDVFEDENGIQLFADLPGVPKDHLVVNVDGDTLVLEGEIMPQLSEQLEAVYAEVQLSRFRRAFTLSSELDTTRIDAELRDGVLNVRVPKHAHAQPRKIVVKSE